MREPIEEVSVVRLGGSGGGRRAALTVGLVIVASGALIGIGAFSRAPTTAPAPIPAVRPSVPITAATAAPTPRPTGILPNEDITTQDGEVAIRSAGYRVAYVVDETHQPAISDKGALAIFGFGDRDAEGGYPDLVSVSVGTPAVGALIPTSRRFPRVYATDLDDLQAAYAQATGLEVTALEDVVIDGEIARRLLARGATPLQSAVAIAVHRNRAFVIAATSVELLKGFVAGFRFGPPLFVSQTLGFQVPQPVRLRPFGTEVGIRPDPVNGLYVFDDGEPIAEDTYSHAIGISVGTETRPALVRVLPSGHQPPQPRRIWAGTLPELVALYVSAAGPGESMRPTILGGEEAILIRGADGLAVTVLAVHDGRAYLVMTSSRVDIEPAPHFQAFLDAFAFL